MRKIVRSAFVVIACLMVQGCIASLLSDYFQEREAEREAKEKIVPASKARFHINDVEYYREDLKMPIIALTPPNPGFQIHRVAIDRENSVLGYAIHAHFRSVNSSGTKGDDSYYLSFSIPDSLFYEGNSYKNAGLVFCSGYSFDFTGDDYRSVAYRSYGDWLKVSIDRFDGFEIGDSLEIRFSFKFSVVDWQFINHIDTDCGVIDSVKCTDGILKEVIGKFMVWD